MFEKSKDFYGQLWPLEVSGGSGGGYELLVREVMHPYGIVMTIFCVIFFEKSRGAALKKLKDSLLFLFLGRAFRGTFTGNFGHWMSLEALVEARSYWFGR